MKKVLAKIFAVVLVLTLLVPANMTMAAEDNVYVVKQGDMLREIAKKYNTTISELVKLNNIKDADLIYVGQKLTLPGAKAKSSKKDLAGKTIILHTNDVHGAIEGYAYIAALKNSLVKRGAEVILADAGDYSQGTCYVSLSKGLNAIKMINKTGYDVVTLGNHEFDYGYAQLKKNLKKLNAELVCADILDADGESVFQANYVYTTKSGVKVGFFGLETPEAKTKANPALIKGLNFLSGEELYDCAQAQVDELADEADLVICLSHLGVDASSKPYTSYDLFDKVEGIDFIIDGHSHTVMTEGENGEPIQSTGTAFANIGVIVIDDATKTIENNYLYEITEDSAKAPKTLAKAQKLEKVVDDEYAVKFAESTVELNGDKAPGNRNMETNLGDLITDSMVWTVMQNADGVKVDADHVVALANGGGIRAWIHAGDVTKKDVNTVLPFGNTIALVYVSGTELLEVLEASCFGAPEAVGGFPQVAGIEFTLDETVAYDSNEETYPNSTYYGPASINRVTITSVNGKEFKADDTYAVITNNFLAAGGDTYYALSAATDQFDTGIPLDEGLMNYITTVLDGVIGDRYAEPAGRITIIPAEAEEQPAA